MYLPGRYGGRRPVFSAGIAAGLVVAWSLDLPYIDGFSAGAIGGLAGGLLIGAVLWAFVRTEAE
jgi:hypothetical protein